MKAKLFLLLLPLALVFTTCKKDLEKISSGTGFGGGLKAYWQPCGQLPETYLNIVSDFGAVPDGVTDCTPAFILAAEFINTHWETNWSNTQRLVLKIPAGTYRVGKQLYVGENYTVGPITVTVNSNTYTVGPVTLSNPNLPGAPTRLEVIIFKLQCCKNISIMGEVGAEGEPTSKILFNDNLYYGGWDGPSGPNPPIPSSVIGETATIGTFIRPINCSCIHIENLDMNGNSQYLFDNGRVNIPDPYFAQREHDAIWIDGSSSVSVKNCWCKYFCRDGITLSATHNGVNPCPNPCNNPEAIYLYKVICEYNHRSGFCWCGGTFVKAEDCSFNKSGKVFLTEVCDPGCGMDIEPDAFCMQGESRNGTFIRCNFIDNRGVGMTSDGHPATVSDISFDTCTFIGITQTPMWPYQMSRTKFNNCYIGGEMYHVAGVSDNDRIEFNDCTFDDKNVHFYGPQAVYQYNRYMLNFGANPPDNMYYLFNHNTFNFHYTRLMITVPIYTTCPHIISDIDGLRVFTNNRFHFYFNDMIAPNPIVTGPNAPPPVPWFTLGNMYNCTFNSNVFEDMNPDNPAPNSFFYFWFGVTVPADQFNFSNWYHCYGDYDCAPCNNPNEPQVSPAYLISKTDGNNLIVPFSTSHIGRAHDAIWGDWNDRFPF